MFTIYLHKVVMCMSVSYVCLSSECQKQGFQNNPEPYHAFGNDDKIVLILRVHFLMRYEMKLQFKLAVLVS